MGWLELKLLDVERGQWTQPTRGIEESAFVLEARDLIEDFADRFAMMSLLNLDEQQGTASPQRFSGAAQDIELGAFDVDLDERKIGELEGIEWLEGDLERRIGVGRCTDTR